MKIKLSKSQWESIGKKAGWMKSGVSREEYISIAKKLQKEAGWKDIVLAVMLVLSGWAAKDIVNQTGVAWDKVQSALKNNEIVLKAKEMQQQMPEVGQMASGGYSDRALRLDTYKDQQERHNKMMGYNNEFPTQSHQVSQDSRGI